MACYTDPSNHFMNILDGWDSRGWNTSCVRKEMNSDSNRPAGAGKGQSAEADTGGGTRAPDERPVCHPAGKPVRGGHHLLLVARNGAHPDVCVLGLRVHSDSAASRFAGTHSGGDHGTAAGRS